jgi:protein required for attachment to host cells
MVPTAHAGNKYYLVVVADESRADLYERERKRGQLRLSRSFENKAAHLKIEDLITDRGGRAFDSYGYGRHTMAAEKSDPKQHLAENLARQVAEYIAAAEHEGHLRGFALIAAPRFLGTLRGQLPNRVHGEPYMTVDKNVVGQPADAIARLLDER